MTDSQAWLAEHAYKARILPVVVIDDAADAVPLARALHAHVVPRYADEPEALRTAHPWAYDWAAAPRFDAAAHGALVEAIRNRVVPARP